MNEDSETARNLKRDIRQRSSQLFLLRIWLVETGENQGQEDWYGRVQHAVTGEAHYFHGCTELAQVLRRMIRRDDVDPAGGTIGYNELEGKP